jgi:hypothetical protein
MIVNDEAVEYTLEAEKGKPNASVFLLKEITCGVSFKVQNEATYIDDKGKYRVKLGEAQKIQLTSCLVGWRNVKNKKGEDLEFSYENVLKLSPKVQTELNEEINRISIPKDDDIKN